MFITPVLRNSGYSQSEQKYWGRNEKKAFDFVLKNHNFEHWRCNGKAKTSADLEHRVNEMDFLDFSSKTCSHTHNKRSKPLLHNS
jgi:hypothetical protein